MSRRREGKKIKNARDRQKREGGKEGEREEVPFTVTFQAHGMDAVGQHNLTIHLHAYTTFFISFNVYI